MAKSKYQKDKEAFLKIEHPHDKLKRLHRESNETWEAHCRASDAERDYIKIFEEEMEKYNNEGEKLNINKIPKNSDYGVDDYPF